jgi:fumarate reductase subunit D
LARPIAAAVVVFALAFANLHAMHRILGHAFHTQMRLKDHAGKLVGYSAKDV